MSGMPSVRRTLAGVLGAQLLTSLADNALLIVAIALLESGAAPAWATPALRVCFYAAYVLLAPLAGPLADRWPKGRLMLLVNVLKLLGAGALACGANPLLVFGAVGLGAAAYAPARYGILPELASGRALVRANAAMEIVTIISILAGVALGSAMVASGAIKVACAVLAGLYALAAASTLLVATPQVAHRPGPASFYAAIKTLLDDRAARFSLGITSVFWACAAVLQFLMIDWARKALGLSLAGAALLPAVLALGMVGGALAAGNAHTAATRNAVAVRGCALGIGILAMTQVTTVWAAALLLLATGLLAGALLVPMNAVLQQRGASLMRPGVSVAVQNFLENGLSLGFLALYGLGIALGASVDAAIYMLGAATIVLVGLLALGRQDRASTAP
jgi:LPLT family lysophospholipid transporter-like MFS transporter